MAETTPQRSPTRAPEEAPATLIDTSKMLAGERAALEATEAARESPATLGFVAELFMGRWRPDKLAVPVLSAPDRAEEARAAKWLGELAGFLRSEVDPDAIDRTGEIPAAVMAGLARLGAYGIKIPREFGGLGFSQEIYLKACVLLGSHCANVFSHLSVHQSVGMPQPLVLFGTEDQKKAWLPRLARGAVSGFALTEAGVGSDPARMTTRSEPDGDSLVINGEKLWCSNGTLAELLVVVARSPSRIIGGRLRDQLTAFAVEVGTPGVAITHRCQFMGLRALNNAVVRFTNVRVPRSAIIGGEGRGLKVALTTLNAGRLSIPAASLGMMKRSLAIAREWCGGRVQWGRPIGQHEAIAGKVRWIATHTFALEAMLSLTARIIDRDPRADIRLEAAMCKLWGTEKAWEALDHLMQLRGGRGYETVGSLAARGEKPHPVERMMRDARVTRIFEGSSEIMRLFIMREALEPHLKAAGAALHSQVSAGQRARAAFAAAGYYAAWYPSTWVPRDLRLPKGIDPRLAAHLAAASRAGRRLSRALFHLMVRHGAGLEKRQLLLGRLADIGSDLFALTAACLHADECIRRGEEAGRVRVVVEDFACLAGARIEQAFRGLRRNADAHGYAVAQQVVAGDHRWLEQGIVER